MYTIKQIERVLAGELPDGGEILYADHQDLRDDKMIRKYLEYLTSREWLERLHGSNFSEENCRRRFDQHMEGGWDYWSDRLTSD